jgi:hypothetical protein
MLPRCTNRQLQSRGKLLPLLLVVAIACVCAIGKSIRGNIR